MLAWVAWVAWVAWMGGRRVVATGVAGMTTRGMFSSLASRNYRLFFWGQLISICGTWMQTVAQSFLVLQLTDSGTDLGLATAARFVPIFLFGPWGGVVADRLDKRRGLFVAATPSARAAPGLGVV